MIHNDQEIPPEQQNELWSAFSPEIAATTDGSGGGTTLALITPADNATVDDGYGSPTFTWSVVPNATQYDFYVAKASAITPGVIFESGLPASTYCNSFTCTLTPTSLDEGNRLTADSYQVWLRALDGNGGVVENWAGPSLFTLNAPAPGVATLLPVTNNTSTTPTFNWELNNTAAYASWFNLYVAPVDNQGTVGTAAINRWYTRSDACGTTVSTTCSLIVSDTLLTPGTRYVEYIKSWGPGGFSTGGISGYSEPVYFNVGGDAPSAPTNIMVAVNQGRPTISWNDDPNAQRFQVYVGLPSPYLEWHDKTDSADPITCDGTTCSLTPNMNPANGTYPIWIQSWGPGGFGIGGSFNESWNQGPDLVLTFTTPSPVTGFFADNLSNGQPTLSWNGARGATWYEVWVGVLGSSTVTHYTSAGRWLLILGCSNLGACSITPNMNLISGTYSWYVRSWGPGGMSDWSNTTFTVP